VESLVSLGWCIRRGTRGEGDGDADYLPPKFSEPVAATSTELNSFLGTFMNNVLAY